MTETDVRNMLISVAKSWIGKKEANGSHREIIDLYNKTTPLPRGYKVKYTDAWCATFVSACGIKSGMADIVHRECGCPKMIDLYKKDGRWMETDTYRPEPGDIIMYDWQDNGVGDNRGNPDHVGIVEKVSGNTITIIEGNIDNAVGRRTLAVGSKFIRGYCLPRFEKKATGNATDYRAAVQKRFGFSDGTMDYLEGYKYSGDLLKKLATAK